MLEVNSFVPHQIVMFFVFQSNGDESSNRGITPLLRWKFRTGMVLQYLSCKWMDIMSLTWPQHLQTGTIEHWKCIIFVMQLPSKLTIVPETG